MAFILERPEGYWVRFTSGDGKRQTIKLGKSKSKTAKEVCRRVELLLEARTANTSCDRETAEWVAGLGKKLRDRLARLGLIDKPSDEAPAVTLDAFVTSYIDKLDVKAGTRFNLHLARRNLVEFFGADKALKAITRGDADDWRRWLKRKYGENTVRRRCGRAKQFFRAAVRKKLIAESPFGDMKDCKVNGNRERDHFISLSDAQKVLDACPDTQWRLLFALSRFGGLRCPSEHSALRWADVDFAKGRMTVRSPKTEHHEGKESRVVPIFPELRPFLEAAKAEAAKGEECVVTIPSVAAFRNGGPSPNLSTRMQKIVARAGLTVWPKLFHNLRASRQTELAQSFPEHVVCEWIGNSQAVAREHYLRVNEADYVKAAGSAAESAALGGESAQQKAQQDAVARNSTLLQCVGNALKTQGIEQVGATVCRAVQVCTKCHIDPKGTRTPVTAVKGRCPRPLDDGAGISAP
jgi:integrase